MNTPDLVVVGHVCRDVTTTPPGWRLGGPAFYAASAAAKLGAAVGVVTAGAAEVDLLEQIPSATVVSLDARRSTSFENRYGPNGRTQYLRALAPPIPADLIPPEWTKTKLALLAPVAGEVPPALARAFPHALLGVSPQGWLRQWDSSGQVRYRSWERPEEVLSHATAVIFSEEDLSGQRAGWLSYPGPIMVMTRGSAGCQLTYRGKRRDVPGFATDEVDPTGAGDVFAAAFLLKLGEEREPLAAARFANAVASFSVQATGTDGLPTNEEVAARLRDVDLALH